MYVFCRTTLLILGVALLPQPLLALDWGLTDPAIKIRSGLTTGSIQNDQHDNRVIGLAASASLPIRGGSALAFELGYDLFPGQNWDATRFDQPVYYNLNGQVISSYQGSPLFLTPNLSGDARAIKMEGFSLRTTWIATAAARFSWQVGLSLDFIRSSSQFTGTLRPVYRTSQGGTTTLPPSNQYEGWAMSVPRTAVTLGAHMGAGYRLSPEHRLEFNIRNIGYGIKDYTPLAYSGQRATLRDKNGRGFVFEVGLSMSM